MLIEFEISFNLLISTFISTALLQNFFFFGLFEISVSQSFVGNQRLIILAIVDPIATTIKKINKLILKEE